MPGMRFRSQRMMAVQVAGASAVVNASLRCGGARIGLEGVGFHGRVSHLVCACRFLQHAEIRGVRGPAR